TEALAIVRRRLQILPAPRTGVGKAKAVLDRRPIQAGPPVDIDRLTQFLQPGADGFALVVLGWQFFKAQLEAEELAPWIALLVEPVGVDQTCRSVVRVGKQRLQETFVL